MRLLLRKGLFGALPEQPPKLHEPMAAREAPGGGQLVLTRSTTNPGVRRWRRITQQGRVFHAPEARTVLSEAFANGGVVYLTRKRVEHPEVRQLVEAGLLELHLEPRHHAHEYRGVLTKAGREHVKRHRENLDRLSRESQVTMFKGGRMRLVLRKAIQARLFGAGPAPAHVPSGTVEVHSHLARDGHGGVHVVKEHERHVGATQVRTGRGALVEKIPHGQYTVTHFEDTRPIDFASGKRMPGSEEDARYCHRCDKKHWRVYHVSGPQGAFQVGEKCAQQMLEGFDPTGEQFKKLEWEHENAARGTTNVAMRAAYDAKAIPIASEVAALPAPAAREEEVAFGGGKARRFYHGDDWAQVILGGSYNDKDLVHGPARAREAWLDRRISERVGAKAGSLDQQVLAQVVRQKLQVAGVVERANEPQWERVELKLRPLRKAADGGALRAHMPSGSPGSSPAARGLRLVASKANPRVKRWEKGDIKPASDHVRYRHPDTGDERTGQVIAGGKDGITVADHTTGQTAKVHHGHYVVSDPPNAKAEPAKPALKVAPKPEGPDWRAKHPGLNKYPPPGVTPDEGKAGDDWKLRWRSPGTGKMVQAYETAYLRENMRGKFRRINGVGAHLPDLRRTLDDHMQLHPSSPAAVKAAMVRMVDHTAMRAGNETSAKQGVHGVSTLEKKHVRVDGDKVHLAYTGKSSVPQEHTLEDPKVAAIVRHLQTLPGDRLFQAADHRGEHQPVTADHLNDYVRSHLGEDHTLKDLRTFHATRLFSEAADRQGPPAKGEDPEAKVRSAALEVAKHLGHKKAITRGHFAVHDEGQAPDPELVKKHGGKVYMHGARRSVGFHSAAEKKAYMQAHGKGAETLPKGEHPEVSPEWKHEEQTSLDNYIDPTVVEAYRKGLTLSGSLQKAVAPDPGRLTADERRFVAYLGKVKAMDPHRFRGAQP